VLVIFSLLGGIILGFTTVNKTKFDVVLVLGVVLASRESDTWFLLRLQNPQVAYSLLRIPCTSRWNSTNTSYNALLAGITPATTHCWQGS